MHGNTQVSTSKKIRETHCRRCLAPLEAARRELLPPYCSTCFALVGDQVMADMEIRVHIEADGWSQDAFELVGALTRLAWLSQVRALQLLEMVASHGEAADRADARRIIGRLSGGSCPTTLGGSAKTAARA